MGFGCFCSRNAETAIFKAFHVSFPLSEFVSFGCPDSRSGFGIPQSAIGRSLDVWPRLQAAVA